MNGERVVKLGGWIQIPTEMLTGVPDFLGGLINRTPAQTAERDRLNHTADQAVIDEYHELQQKLSRTDYHLRSILDLHYPDGRYCAGCDGGDPPADWPCRTVVRIAETIGTEVAADPWGDGYRAAQQKENG